VDLPAMFARQPGQRTTAEKFRIIRMGQDGENDIIHGRDFW